MLINDYKKYINENAELINNLKSKDFSLYERINDALKVMNFICATYEIQNNIDDDLKIIFETGVGYIEDTLETTKIYLNNYFNNDLKQLKKYDHLINYLLYLDDITEVLKEKKLYDEKKLEFIGTEIEDILINKTNYNQSITTKFDEAINDCITSNEDIHTTYEIFLMIAEELEI